MFIPCSVCKSPVRIFLALESIVCRSCASSLPRVPIMDVEIVHLHSDLSPVDSNVIRHDLGVHDFD